MFKLVKENYRMLKGRWMTAITVQLLVRTLTITVLAVQLVLSGLPRALYWMAGLTLLDWLILSPIKAGQAAFFWQLTGAGAKPGLLVLGRFFGRLYGRALLWRGCVWTLQMGMGLVCFLPAFVAFAAVRYQLDTGLDTLIHQMTLLFGVLVFFLLLLAGVLGHFLFMLRYMPAVYFLQDCNVRKSFRRAASIRKRRGDKASRLYSTNAVWLALQLLGLPFLAVSPLFGAAKAGWVKEREKL